MSSMDDLAALVYALEASLHLREASDWLRVSEGQLPFGRAMIRSHGGLSKVVQHFYGIDLTDASFAHKSGIFFFLQGFLFHFLGFSSFH